MNLRGRSGFTLIELMVSIAIVALLAGILYTATGTVRERARRTKCMSNLRQIGVAITLYRQDYGGREYGTAEAMGLPLGMESLLGRRGPNMTFAGGRYGLTEEVFRCSRLQCPTIENGARVWQHFGIQCWPDSVSRRYPQVPLFATVVRERGPNFPLVIDGNHDDAPKDRPPMSHRPFVMVWRLGGHLTVGRVPPPRHGSWEY